MSEVIKQFIQFITYSVITPTALQFSRHEHMLSIDCGTRCAGSCNSSAGQAGPGIYDTCLIVE